MINEEALRHVAISRILSVRGSSDVPGFDFCVDSEVEILRPIIEIYLSHISLPDSCAVSCILVGVAKDES